MKLDLEIKYNDIMICNTTCFWQDTKQLSHYNIKFIDLDKTLSDTGDRILSVFLGWRLNKLINLISSWRMLILCYGRYRAPFVIVLLIAIMIRVVTYVSVAHSTVYQQGCLNISRYYHQIFKSRNIKWRRAITENQSKRSHPLSIFIL